jgi:hypothetical protein
LGIFNYIIPYRAPLEVISIKGPTKPVQNGPLLFSIMVRNNRLTSTHLEIQLIRVLDNGANLIMAEYSWTVLPGENGKIITYVESLQNPWDVGNREYLIIVRSAMGTEYGRNTVISDVQLSIENVIFGYVLVFAIIGIVFLVAIYKKRQLSSVRR